MRQIKKPKDFLILGKKIYNINPFPFFIKGEKKYNQFQSFLFFKSKLNRDIIARYFYPLLIYRSRVGFNKNWAYNYFLNYYSLYKINLQHKKISDHKSRHRAEPLCIKKDRAIEEPAKKSNAISTIRCNQNFQNTTSSECENLRLIYQIASDKFPVLFSRGIKNSPRANIPSMENSAANHNGEKRQVNFNYIAHLEKPLGIKFENLMQQHPADEPQMILATRQKRQHQGPDLNMVPLELSHFVPGIPFHADLTEPGENEIRQSGILTKPTPIRKSLDFSQEPKSIDINNMADQVYHLIEKKIQVENERSGRWY